MTSVSTSVHVPASAPEVWARNGAFDAVADWHPAVQRVTLEEGGTVRRAHLAGGGESVERLIEGGETGALVRWSSEFTAAGTPPSETATTIRGFLQSGLDNLANAVGRRH